MNDAPYWRAFRTRMWQDIYSGAVSKSRMLIEGAVSFIVAIMCLTQLGSTGWSLRDYGVEKLIAVPATAGLMAILHVLWSFVVVPKALYDEQQSRIADLTAALEPKLTIKVIREGISAFISEGEPLWRACKTQSATELAPNALAAWGSFYVRNVTGPS